MDEMTNSVHQGLGLQGIPLPVIPDDSEQVWQLAKVLVDLPADRLEVLKEFIRLKQTEHAQIQWSCQSAR